MKKNIFFAIVIALFAFIACSNQDNITPIEKVEEPIALVKDFDAFNAALAAQVGVARQYDVTTNELNLPTTRARNWRKIWRADARGAFWGALKGLFRGGIAGGIMGALLEGATASAIEYFWQTEPVAPTQTQLYAMVTSEEIFEAEAVYELGLGIEARYYLDQEMGYEEGEVTDSIELAVGLAHNMFMDAFLAPASSGGGSEDGGGDSDTGSDGDPVGVYEMFGDDFTAEGVYSELFQEEFSDFVMDAIQSYQEEALDEEGTESDTVMNLFMEAVDLCDGDREDIDAVVRYYQFNIQQSEELTADEKQALYFGMVVAVYSIEYWNEVNEAPGNDEDGDGDSGNGDENSGQETGEEIEP